MKIKHHTLLNESVKKFPIFSFLVGAAALFIVTVWWLHSDISHGIERDKFQIVTLSNGEVYVGHLSNIGGSYAALKNVYFQQGKPTSSTEATPAESSNDVVVVKLAATVAKPEDQLRINATEIIHWANLDADSKIVKAIEQDPQAQ